MARARMPRRNELGRVTGPTLPKRSPTRQTATPRSPRAPRSCYRRPMVAAAPPPRLDLAAVLSHLCEDAFFTVAGSARLDVEALRALAQKRAPALVSAARGVASPGLDAWDPWIITLCAVLAPIAPPRWVPLADAIADGLSLEHGARGVRSLFTSKPSDKEVARVRGLGGMGVRAITSV